MVKNNVRSDHQCAQSPPLSTRLTVRPVWDKTKKKGFHENRRFSKDHLQGIVTPMFEIFKCMVLNWLFLIVPLFTITQ